MDFTLPEELVMVRDTVREFVQNELLPIERDVLVREKGGSRGAPIPREKQARLKKLAVEQGLWAMTAPESLGGGGLNTLGTCLVAEELGKTFVEFSFGHIPPLLYEANEEQKARYLSGLISGERECALALVEPAAANATANATALATRAVLDGKLWQLNGEKLAGEADLYLVIAQTEQGPACFIVESEWDGVHWRSGHLTLENVRVPASNILGEAGNAWKLGTAYQAASQVRAAARKLGIAARLLEMATQYARDYKLLGQPLAVRPAVQRYLADIATELDAGRWLVYHAACEIDAGHAAREVGLSASLFASEMVERAMDRTIEVYGGPLQAADLGVPRIYRSDGERRAAQNGRRLPAPRYRALDLFRSDRRQEKRIQLSCDRPEETALCGYYEMHRMWKLCRSVPPEGPNRGHVQRGYGQARSHLCPVPASRPAQVHGRSHQMCLCHARGLRQDPSLQRGVQGRGD